MKKKYDSIKNLLNFFMTALFLVLYISCTFSMESEERINRNWIQSLNFSVKGYQTQFDVDSWVRSKEGFISTKNRNRLVKELLGEIVGDRNIAMASFNLFYKVVNDREEVELHYSNFFPHEIFISGLGEFDSRAGENLKDGVSICKNFYPLLNGGSLNAELKKDINLIIGKNTQTSVPSGNNIWTGVKDGTHSEVIILHSLASVLAKKMDLIFELEHNNMIHIVGSALMIRSLKDPCADNCFPMLEEFSNNLTTILRERIPNGARISIANHLENIILLAGNLEHRYSRRNLNISTDNILLDFDNPHPHPRIYSMQAGDLKPDVG